MAVSIVLKEVVAEPHGSNQQVLIAVVVDIGEGSGYFDFIRQSDARRRGDILEFAAAKIPPLLTGAYLVDEVDVVKPVAIHIRHCNSVAVIVVHPHVVDAGFFDNMRTERDAALLPFIGELELVKDLELVDGVHLGLLARRKRTHTYVGSRELDLRHLRNLGSGTGCTESDGCGHGCNEITYDRTSGICNSPRLIQNPSLGHTGGVAVRLLGRHSRFYFF
jgi:hypothetical protein